MDWIWIIGGLWLGRYLIKHDLFRVTGTGPVRTIRSVRKTYKNNVHMINKLPLSQEEREAAQEVARQKMLRDLDNLMGP